MSRWVRVRSVGILLALAAGCSDSSSGSGEDECKVGTEGCECTSGGLCDYGLSCIDMMCVAPGGDSGSGAGGTGSGDASTSGAGTGGGSSDGGSTTSGGVGSGGTSSTGTVTDGATSGPETTSMSSDTGAGSTSTGGATTTDTSTEPTTTTADTTGGTGVEPGPAVSIDAGFDYTCAVVGGAKLRCWGNGEYGQLGYAATDNIGDNEAPSTAGDVNVGGNVVQVSAGSGHTCALLDTGAVRCWGRNAYAQLGYGNDEPIGDDEIPAMAGNVDIGGTVTALAAGGIHTCALLEGGAVRCWGWGHLGRLGYGDSEAIGDNEVPADKGDVNVGGVVVAIGTGRDHTCALLDGGAVRCWGSGTNGRLGYNNVSNIGDTEDPATAGDVNIGGTATKIAVGGAHACALLDTGAVRCWGEGEFGQLGYADTENVGAINEPADVGDVDVGGTVVEIAAGNEHTCVLLAAGTVRCWGNGAAGRLGYGDVMSIGDTEHPATAAGVDVGASVSRLTAGSEHTCALLQGGAVRCWGQAEVGQLGYGDTVDIGDNEAPSTAGNVPL